MTESDIPSLDPLTVEWLLGEREDPMVPMRVLPGRTSGPVVGIEPEDAMKSRIAWLVVASSFSLIALKSQAQGDFTTH